MSFTLLVRKFLIFAGAGTAAALLAALFLLRSGPDEPRAVTRACDVLTDEVARSLLGAVSRGNDDHDPLITQCQYRTVPVSGSITLQARRFLAAKTGSAVQRARWDILRRQRMENGTAYPGLGDEAYLFVSNGHLRPPSAPSTWSGSRASLHVRVQDLRVTVLFNGRVAPEQAQTALDRLVRAYLARSG